MAAARKMRSLVRRMNFGTDATQRMIHTIAGTPSYAWCLPQYMGPDLKLKQRAASRMFQLWYEAYGDEPYPRETSSDDEDGQD